LRHRQLDKAGAAFKQYRGAAHAEPQRVVEIQLLFDAAAGAPPAALRFSRESLLLGAPPRAHPAPPRLAGRRSGRLTTVLAKHFNPSVASALIRRFVRDDVCNTLQLVLEELVDDAEDEPDGEEAVEGTTSTGGLLMVGVRGRMRRLIESVWPLCDLRCVGSQEAMPEFKKLFRRIDRFLDVPERRVNLMSGLRRQGSARPLAADLQQRALLLREQTRTLSAKHTMMICEDNAPYYEVAAPGLGETVHASMSHWTAVGSVPLRPATGTLGDGRHLSTAVGAFTATAGPLLGVTFCELRLGAYSSSHPGLRLEVAEHARRNDPTCKWEQEDGTLLRSLQLVPGHVNMEGVSMRTHVPVLPQWDHLKAQELLQHLSNLWRFYGNLDAYSGAVLPQHAWSVLVRKPEAPLGEYVEGPANGLQAHSREFYRGGWTNDGKAHKVQLRIEEPAPINSLAADEQWSLLLDLALRHGAHLSPGLYHLCGQSGDAQRPLLQADLGTYSVVLGLLKRQMKAVARGGFDSEEHAKARPQYILLAYSTSLVLHIPRHCSASPHCPTCCGRQCWRHCGSCTPCTTRCGRRCTTSSKSSRGRSSGGGRTAASTPSAP